MYLAPLNVLFHNTIIHETELWSFDYFRKYLPKAENYCISGKGEFWYSYYLLDSIEGKMLRLFTHGSLDISSREPNYNQLLIFQNEQEKEAFDKYRLTPKEREVIGLILDDMNDDEIADKLSISRATLKTHIYNIYRKTNVKNRLQLIILAKQ